MVFPEVEKMADLDVHHMRPQLAFDHGLVVFEIEHPPEDVAHHADGHGLELFVDGDDLHILIDPAVDLIVVYAPRYDLQVRIGPHLPEPGH